MKNFWVFLSVLAVVVVLVLFAVVFQVRQTETVIVTRFGDPVRPITKPGLYLRYPLPIERVNRFDSRSRLYEGVLEETNTAGNEPIIVNSYVVWRITDPLQFYNSVGTIDSAEIKLRSQIHDTQNRVIGQYTFGEFINSDPNKIRFDDIQEKMLKDLAPRVAKEYGIEVKTLGIKQLKISQENTKEVFARMKAERKRRTEATIALGTAEATRIRTDADAMKTALLAAAEGRAKAIQGRGDAEAATYLAKMEQDPELAMFLRSLDMLGTLGEERTTLVIPTDCEPFSLLKNVPSLKPVEPKK